MAGRKTRPRRTKATKKTRSRKKATTRKSKGANLSFEAELFKAADKLRGNTARARMRVLAKRILRKYGYPPDLQEEPIQTVGQQAEALSAARSM